MNYLQRSKPFKPLALLLLCSLAQPADAGLFDKIKEIGRGIKEKTGAVKDTIVNGKGAKEDVDEIRAELTYADTDSLNQTQIYQLQLGLIARGYDAGVADGKVGSKTRRAIKQFQRDSGIASTGALSLQLLSAVQSNSTVRASAAANTKELTRSEWKQLQSELNSLGFNTGRPDGIPGKKTKSAMQRYLSSQGEPRDTSPRAALLLLTTGKTASTNLLASNNAQNSGGGGDTNTATNKSAEASLESANGETIYTFDLSRLKLKNGAVMLKRMAKQSAADANLSHYGMLLDLKLNTNIDKEFEARTMHSRPSRLLCLANYLLSESDKNKYLAEEGSLIHSSLVRSRKPQLLRFWKGDNEFANRRAHAQFLEEVLPRFLEASLNVPTRVAISSNFELGDYDFANQEFKLRYGAVFSAKRPFNAGNVGLSGACRSGAPLVKNTQFLAIADTLKMPAAQAEALLKSLGNERDSKILEQITYLELSAKTDRYNQAKFAVEPVGAELYRGKGATDQLFSIGLASADTPYVVSYVADGAAAAGPVHEGAAPEASSEVLVTQPSVDSCSADCDQSLTERLSLRRHDNIPLAVGLLTAQKFNYSDTDSAEIAKYMDLLTISAWKNSGARMSADQEDRLSERVALCLASRFLSTDQSAKYINFAKSAKPTLGTWLGADQFEKRRSRLAFVETAWPRLEAALPAFPADFSIVSTIGLENYDFNQQLFPLALPSPTSLRVQPTCGIGADFRNTVSRLPQSLEMPAADAEKLLLAIDELRPGRSQQIIPDKPYLFAVLQMQLKPLKVDVAAYRSKVTFDSSTIKVSLFLDAELKRPVHQWEFNKAAVEVAVEKSTAKSKPVATKAKPVEAVAEASAKAVNSAVSFAPRTLALLDVNLNMTLSEAVTVLENSLAGTNYKKVDLQRLQSSTRLSVSPCDVKRNNIRTEIRTLGRKLTNSKLQACLEKASQEGSGANLCTSTEQSLSAEEEQSLLSKEKELLAKLPAECALEEDVFVAYAGYDVDYGADLKDRFVIFAKKDAKPSDNLLAMSRVLQDKSKKIDVLAKLNDAFEGNSYSRSKRKSAKRLWFEDPALQNKVVNQESWQQQCGASSRVGIDSRGKITDKFPHACGRFASYLNSGGKHYILLVNSDYSAGINAQRQKAVVKSEDSAASAVKF